MFRRASSIENSQKIAAGFNTVWGAMKRFATDCWKSFWDLFDEPKDQPGVTKVQPPVEQGTTAKATVFFQDQDQATQKNSDLLYTSNPAPVKPTEKQKRQEQSENFSFSCFAGLAKIWGLYSVEGQYQKAVNPEDHYTPSHYYNPFGLG